MSYPVESLSLPKAFDLLHEFEELVLQTLREDMTYLTQVREVLLVLRSYGVTSSTTIKVYEDVSTRIDVISFLRHNVVGMSETIDEFLSDWIVTFLDTGVDTVAILNQNVKFQGC